MPTRNAAPKYLNLLKIKLPPGGIASIAHRISGVFMFLCIPVLAFLFGLSLESEEGFRQARGYLASTPAILVSLLLVWSFGHHLLAGLRHLLLDIDIGVHKPQARASAWMVNLGALLITALYAVSVL